MADPPPYADTGDDTSTPRWVKVSGIVTLPNDVEAGTCITIGRNHRDATLTWDDAHGVAIHTFYGCSYLTHEQEAALGRLAEWLRGHRAVFDGSRPIWNGLVHAKPSDDDLALFNDFRAIFGCVGFEELFQHARRLREAGTMKRIEFTDGEFV